jgi:hypothetical protein
MATDGLPWASYRGAGGLYGWRGSRLAKASDGRCADAPTGDRCEHVPPAVAAPLTRAQQPREQMAVRIVKSFDDIVDHCCYACNTLICPSRNATARPSVTHYDDWYKIISSSIIIAHEAQ